MTKHDLSDLLETVAIMLREVADLIDTARRFLPARKPPQRHVPAQWLN
jgi:hypothetical protein